MNHKLGVRFIYASESSLSAKVGPCILNSLLKCWLLFCCCECLLLLIHLRHRVVCFSCCVRVARFVLVLPLATFRLLKFFCWTATQLTKSTIFKFNTFLNLVPTLKNDKSQNFYNKCTMEFDLQWHRGSSIYTRYLPSSFISRPRLLIYVLFSVFFRLTCLKVEILPKYFNHGYQW